MLTGVVLARNEAHNLPACLTAINFCDEVLVIDDNSTDRTSSLAKKTGAMVVNHSLDSDFSAQRNFAMSQAKHDWVLFVDPDEIVSSELAAEIKLAVSQTNYSAYFLHRTDYMWGCVLKHGDAGNFKLIRLVRKHTGSWAGRVHEVWITSQPVGDLSGQLIHHPHPDLKQFLSSINQYSTIRAEELFSQNNSVSAFQIISYPAGKFLNLWLVKMGFLDGIPGLIHALVMSFYSFLVRGKLYLLAKGIR